MLREEALWRQFLAHSAQGGTLQHSQMRSRCDRVTPLERLCPPQNFLHVIQCENETKKRGFKGWNGVAERKRSASKRKTGRFEKENGPLRKGKRAASKRKTGRFEKENGRFEKENGRFGSFRGGFFRVGLSRQGKRTAEKKRFFLKGEKPVKLTRGSCTDLESHTRCASRAHVVRLYVP
jgi:hypothetical protein